MSVCYETSTLNTAVHFYLNIGVCQKKLFQFFGGGHVTYLFESWIDSVSQKQLKLET